MSQYRSPNPKGELKCGSCKKDMPKANFYRRKKRETEQYLSYCRGCRQRDRLKSRLRHSYGMTVDDLNLLMRKQDNKCAICNIDQSQLEKRLDIDHCHKTGRVRGLLCPKCNKAIGLLKDSSEMLDKASNYLKG